MRVLEAFAIALEVQHTKKIYQVVYLTCHVRSRNPKEVRRGLRTATLTTENPGKSCAS